MHMHVNRKSRDWRRVPSSLTLHQPVPAMNASSPGQPGLIDEKTIDFHFPRCPHQGTFPPLFNPIFICSFLLRPIRESGKAATATGSHSSQRPQLKSWLPLQGDNITSQQRHSFIRVLSCRVASSSLPIFFFLTRLRLPVCTTTCSISPFKDDAYSAWPVRHLFSCADDTSTALIPHCHPSFRDPG